MSNNGLSVPEARKEAVKWMGWLHEQANAGTTSENVLEESRGSEKSGYDVRTISFSSVPSMDIHSVPFTTFKKYIDAGVKDVNFIHKAVQNNIDADMAASMGGEKWKL